MADSEKTSKPVEAEKAPAATTAPKHTEPERPPTKRTTKIVAETGRYICKHAIVFTAPDGKRATARAGEIVSIRDDDAAPLKKRRVIESEEESAEA
jgi:hypothetical protein